MSRPGVEVTSAASAPPLGVPTDTSVAFIIAEAQMGPTDAPVRITSQDEFTAAFGGRIAGTYGYDAVDAYFHEGGTSAYFMRLADTTAQAATGSSTAIAAGSTLSAASAGAWANGAKLDVVTTPGLATQEAKSSSSGKSKDASNGAPARSELLTYDAEAQATSTFMATVTVAGKIVQTSQPLTTLDQLSSFLAQGSYLRITGPAGTPVAAGSATLAGGADGTVPVTDTNALPAALALIPRQLGPGQVLAPGKSDVASHGALLAHAASSNRVALLDAGPTDDATALTSAAAVLRGAQEDRYGALWAPWAVIPGLAPGTTRQVPWSAVQAGMCAGSDLAGNPNQAVAGGWGESAYAVGLTRTFTADEMESLLYAGVDTARYVYGTIEAYAFRTLVDPSGPRAAWVELNHARLNMAIVAQSEAIGEDYVFSQLDGRGHTIAAFGGALAGMLVAFYNGDALFGDDPTEAFVVNVGPAVNTVAKLAQGILSAVLSVRMSPHAELVQIEIVKVPITVSLT